MATEELGTVFFGMLPNARAAEKTVISVVVSVVSAVSFRWFRPFRFGGFARFGGFGCFVSVVSVVSVVSAVSFRWFRFVVSGFSTCRQDGGNYKCKARDKSGQTIESSQVFLLIDRGTLI